VLVATMIGPQYYNPSPKEKCAMSSDAISVNTMAAYQTICIDIIKIVAAAKLTGRQNNTIAQLSSDPPSLLKQAMENALSILQDGMTVPPTYVMLSKAGDGLTIPVVLDQMPDDDDTRVSVVGPLSLLTRLAPIDCYYFMSEMWGAFDRQNETRRPIDRPDRMTILRINTFNDKQSHSACFTLVRHPETDKVMALYPFHFPSADYDSNNPCLMNFYDLADSVLNTMSPSEIVKFTADILDQH
jgi:hypothetical protein